MNKVKRYLFSMFLTLSFVMLLSICSYAEEFYYATTDMTWAEFYAGEVGEAQAELEAQHLDAISTPTTTAATRFPLLDISSGSNGETGQTITTFSGYIEVPVRMTEAVYNSLSDADKERFDFVETEFD